MAYHLSRTNRNLVEIIVDKLRDKEGEVKLKTNNPGRLEGILRSAINLHSEFNWIGEKFIISVKDDHLYFKPKQILIEVIEEEPEEFEDQTFFDIMNILLIQQKDNLKFIRPDITDDELERIKEWGIKNNYHVNLDYGLLMVKKNG